MRMHAVQMDASLPTVLTAVLPLLQCAAVLNLIAVLNLLQCSVHTDCAATTLPHLPQCAAAVCLPCALGPFLQPVHGLTNFPTLFLPLSRNFIT